MTAEVFNLPRSGGSWPAPLVPAGINIRAVEGTMLDNYDMLESDWISRLDLAERGAAMTLHLVAMKQQPSGSLPDDDVLLAGYLGFSLREVDLWLSIKTKVMNGWVLCSDGRWYHPYRAKNVLRLWIGWRETNRRSSLGNGTRSAAVRRGVREIEADIEFAAEALRALDPKDKFLDDLEVRISKWTTRPRAVASAEEVTEAVTSSKPTVTEAITPSTPPLDGGQRLGQAKPGQKDSSSLLRRDDSSDRQGEPSLDLGLDEGSVKRTDPATAKRERAPPWPADWFEVFKARYPKREAWGRAEKVLERIRKAGKVPFEEIMAGVERLVARIAAGRLQAQFACQPAKWLEGRGWEDEPDERSVVVDKAEILPPTRGSPGASITRRAAMRLAERLGIRDEHHPGA